MKIRFFAPIFARNFPSIVASFFAVCLSSAGMQAYAAEQTSTVATAGNFFQVLMGLIVVLALMAVAAWLLKKFGSGKAAGNAAIKIVGGISVGNRERIIVVEVADQWIVVGVAPGQVNALSTMARQENPVSPALPPVAPVAKNFSAWFKQTIDKRHDH